MQSTKPTEDAFDLRLTRTTPTPNAVLEAALTLPETQAKLLLLVTRDTLGYAAGPGRRRASVRLSHAQIGRRIGRSSTAISQAIDGLVQMELLEVTDDEGKVLATGRERQLLRAALRFRLPRRRVEAVEKRATERPAGAIALAASGPTLFRLGEKKRK